MSQLNVDTIKNAAGTHERFPCTAWVNFNGTGTIAIRDNGNVSSLTDNATGDYTLNFATAFVNTNYSTNGEWALTFNNGSKCIVSQLSYMTTSSFRFKCVQNTASTDSEKDGEVVSVQIFGGLA